jgi:hypothetical protein
MMKYLLEKPNSDTSFSDDHKRGIPIITACHNLHTRIRCSRELPADQMVRRSISI